VGFEPMILVFEESKRIGYIRDALEQCDRVYREENDYNDAITNGEMDGASAKHTRVYLENLMGCDYLQNVG
jgi:hypothetical protein